MKSAFNKEIVRSIRSSMGRFIAIAIISLLGAGVYAGLRMSAPDMRLAGDEFFDSTALYDISVVSSLGLDDTSLGLLQDIEGVEQVMPAYHGDAMAEIDGRSYVVGIESLPTAALQSETSDGVHALSDDAAYLNRPILVEGEWPHTDDECVLGFNQALEAGITLGDVVRLQKGDPALDDTFDTLVFTVTGFVNSAAFISDQQLGSSSLGGGTLQLYMYVPAGAFADDLPYSSIYVTVANAADEVWDNAGYDETVETVAERIRTQASAIATARRQAIQADAQEELDDAKRTYESERSDAQEQLRDAARELSDADAELADAQSQLVSAHDELQESLDKLADSKKQLDQGEADYEQGMAQLKAQQAELQPMIDQLPSLIQQRDQLAQTPGVPAETLKELETNIAQIQGGAAALESARTQLETARAQLDAGWEAYENGVAQYNEGLQKYNEGVADYNEGRAQLNSGRQEFEENRQEAQEKFDDAAADLAQAQTDIDTIEDPEVYVLDRTKNPGAASLSHDAESITQIATFFPFVFILVAALVVLTSMTRMVDEERLDIGTHKALGYGKLRITMKYLVYGALASGIGSVIGVLTLGQALPWFIMVSYHINYSVPVFSTPIDAIISAKAIGITVGVALIATWGAAAASLRETPALLMLPRAPKAGKRIILERITPIWKRMSFSYKVTARNLLRYKRRFFMAVIGIAGCTALLMIGFGLRDAIGGIVENQYNELVTYDVAVKLDEEATDDERAAIMQVLQDERVESTLAAADVNMVSSGPAEDVRMDVIVPVDADADALGDFITLRERESGESIQLDAGTVVLAEKTAKVLDVLPGGTVALYDENMVGDKVGSGHYFTVGAVTENYLQHYAYMLPALYEEITGQVPAFDFIYVNLVPDVAGSTEEEDLIAALLETPGVSTVSSMSEKIVQYEDMLDVMGKLIIVVVLLAAALAFVVLYNLTNINISERVREIATLKVLGFTPKEVDAYIFREVLIMVIVGALLGCVLGVPLTFYIAEAAETQIMMFGRSISAFSFVASFVITVAFTFIVVFAMRRKLAAVNMVESLKSIE